MKKDSNRLEFQIGNIELCFNEIEEFTLIMATITIEAITAEFGSADESAEDESAESNLTET